MGAYDYPQTAHQNQQPDRPMSAQEAAQKAHMHELKYRAEQNYLNKMAALPPPEEAFSVSAIKDAARAAIDQDLSNGKDIAEVVEALNKLPFTKQLLDRMLAGEGV